MFYWSNYTIPSHLRSARDYAGPPTAPDLDELGADCVPDACSDPGASVSEGVAF